MKKITLLLTAVFVLSAVSMYAQSAQTHFDNGKRLYDQDKDDEAIQEFTAAIRLNPNMAEAYAYRGRLYSYRRDYDRAISDFEAALRINPNLQDAKADLTSAREAQRGQSARVDPMAEAMLNEVEKRMGRIESAMRGEPQARGFRVEGFFDVIRYGKNQRMTFKEDVQAMSEGDARQKVQTAIYNQYPAANNLNVTRITRF